LIEAAKEKKVFAKMVSPAFEHWHGIITI